MCYCICFTVLKKYKKMIAGPGMTMLHVIIFLRYCIVPLSISLNNSLDIYAKDYNHIGAAIIIMIIEMLSIFVTLFLIKEKSFPKEKPVSEDASFVRFTRNDVFAIVIILVIACIIVCVPSVLGSFYLLFSNTEYNNIVYNVPGPVWMLWKAAIAFIYVYVIVILKRSGYSETTKVVFSVILSVTYLVHIYIGQAVISRWYLVTSSIASCFLLAESYPRRKKPIVIAIMLPVAIILITASMTKNTDIVFSDSRDLITAVKALFSPTNMDTYFAGPVSVNNAIGMVLNRDVSILNLPYDLLHNFPGLADHVDTTMVTNKIYNLWIFDGSDRFDQILPLVGQSLALFSWLGIPLLSIIDVRLIVLFDKKYSQSKDIRKYVYAFTGIWLGVAPILNMTISISWFYVYIIPLYSVLWFYSKICTTEYVIFKKVDL